MWSDDDVRDAAAEWTWIPDGSRVHDDELLIVQRPAWVGGHVAVEGVRSARPPSELIEQAATVASEWADDALEWAVSDRDDPALDAALLARGATLTEQLDVLALPLDRALGLPAGAGARRVATRDDVLAVGRINSAVWANAEPDEARIAEVLREEQGGSGFRILAELDGEVVSTGGVTLAPGPRGTVARLWGAATLEHARGRGAYRAVLAERLRLAAEAGATLALVKGRIATSAPILTRAGFRRYGAERRYRLPL